MWGSCSVAAMRRPKRSSRETTPGGWVEHRGATGAQCMDRGVVCDTGIWYPDNLQRQGSQDEGGRSEWVQMPDQTGAECENPGVICGSTAS